MNEHTKWKIIIIQTVMKKILKLLKIEISGFKYTYTQIKFYAHICQIDIKTSISILFLYFLAFFLKLYKFFLNQTR